MQQEKSSSLCGERKIALVNNPVVRGITEDKEYPKRYKLAIIYYPLDGMLPHLLLLPFSPRPPPPINISSDSLNTLPVPAHTPEW